MSYAILASAVVVIHFGFVVFLAAGGFIAWRRPLVLVAHVPSVAWALGIVAVGYACPLTALENDLRARAGTHVYEGGFIDRYLTGVLYPTRYEHLLQILLAIGIVAAYIGLGLRWRRCSASFDVDVDVADAEVDRQVEIGVRVALDDHSIVEAVIDDVEHAGGADIGLSVD